MNMDPADIIKRIFKKFAFIDTIAKILTLTTEERKAKGINKSTLWYQQKKIKEGKTIRVYNKIRGKIE